MFSYKNKGEPAFSHTIRFSTGADDQSIILGGDRSGPAPARYSQRPGTDFAVVEDVGGGRTSWKIFNSTAKLQQTVRLDVAVDYTIAGCDFDGDKRDDIAGVSLAERALYFKPLPESEQVIKVTLQGFPLNRAITDLSCGDFNDDGKADLVLLSPPQRKAKGKAAVITEDIIYSFDSSGKQLSATRIRNSPSGIFSVRVAKKAPSVFGFYYKTEKGAIEKLYFLMAKSGKMRAIKMQIPASKQFGGGTFDRPVTTRLTDGTVSRGVKVFAGLQLVQSKNAVVRLDLEELKAGVIKPAVANAQTTDLSQIRSFTLGRCVNTHRVRK